MGYYIETPVHKNKAQWLVKNAEGVITRDPQFVDDDRVTVCVVDNGPFEAAGIAFSAREFEAFTQPDDERFKTWVTVPKKYAASVNLQYRKYLENQGWKE